MAVKPSPLLSGCPYLLFQILVQDICLIQKSYTALPPKTGQKVLNEQDIPSTIPNTTPASLHF